MRIETEWLYYTISEREGLAAMDLLDKLSRTWIRSVDGK